MECFRFYELRLTAPRPPDKSPPQIKFIILDNQVVGMVFSGSATCQNRVAQFEDLISAIGGLAADGRLADIDFGARFVDETELRQIEQQADNAQCASEEFQTCAAHSKGAFESVLETLDDLEREISERRAAGQLNVDWLDGRVVEHLDAVRKFEPEFKGGF